MTNDVPKNPPLRRRRWRRRLVVAFVSLLALVVLIIVGVRVVLATDLPRRLLVRELRDATGLDVRIGSLDVGWRGRSRATDLVISLPLDGETLFAAHTVEVAHASLPRLVITRDPGLEMIRMDGVSLDARQEPSGRWNIARAIDAVRAVAKPGARPSSAVALPRVVVTNSTATVATPGHDPLTLPLTIDLTPEAGVAASFDVSLGPLHSTGRFSTSAFTHQLTLTATDLSPIARLWTPDVPAPLVVDAVWEGRPTGNGVSGVLTLHTARAGPNDVSGTVGVEVHDGTAVIEPTTLVASSPRLPRSPATIAGGRMTLRAADAGAERVAVTVPGITAEVGGHWSFQRAAGEVVASWSGREPDVELEHTGRATVSVKIPAVGPREIAAKVSSSGEIGSREWRAEAAGSFSGDSWDTLAGALAFPTLIVTTDGEPVDVSGLAANLSSRLPVVTVTSLTLPGSSSTDAHATVDTSSWKWTLALDTPAWTPPRAGGRTIALHVRASGDAHRASASEARVSMGDTSLSGSATFDEARETPLVAHATLSAKAPVRIGVVSADAAGDGDRAAPAPPVAPAEIAATFDVRGRVSPLALELEGVTTLSNARIGDQELDPVRVPARASIDSRALAFHSDPFAVLDAVATLSGTWQRGAPNADVHADLERLSLARVAPLVSKDAPVSGTLAASLDAAIPIDGPEHAALEGTWTISDVAAGPIRAPNASGRIELRDRMLVVRDFSVERPGASIGGTASLSLDSPELIHADLTADRWPVDIGSAGFAALVNLESKVDLDAAQRTAKGTARLHADVLRAGHDLGAIDADAALDGRTAHATKLAASVLGGTIRGTADVPIDAWSRANVDLTLDALDLSRIAEFAPEAGDLRGTLSGTVKASPAGDPNAPEPLRFDAALAVADGVFRSMELRGATLTGSAGPSRVILDKSSLGIAGGEVKVWSNLSYQDQEPLVHISAEAANLRVDQLARAASPDSPALLGIIGGRAVAGGYLTTPHRGFGDADLMLTEADFGRAPIIAQLYSLLSLDMSGSEPKGIGQVRLRLENDSLVLSRLHYFNRGVDVAGTARIQDIWQGPASPVTGTFAAAIRPLGNSFIPFGEELDRALGAIFKNAVSVQLDGTLGERRTQVVPFASIADAFLRAIGVSPSP